MNATVKRIFSFVIAVSLLNTAFASNTVYVKADENGKRKVKIGCSVSTGYYQYDESGNIRGVGHDYEDVLQKYAGWDIEYVEETWSELNQMLQNGEIDLLGFLVKTKEREQVFDFADFESGVSKSCLIVLESDTKYFYEDYSAFSGMTIGYQQGNANLDNMRQWCDKHGFSVNAKEYSSVTEVFKALENKEIDSALVTNFNNLNGYRIIAKMLPENIYYAVKKGNEELLSELNSALDEALIYYPNLSNELYLDYYDEKNGYQISFTKEEEEWLKTNPSVSVFPGSRDMPYEYYNEDSNAYCGIVPDVLKRISQITGIQFDYVPSDSRWGYYQDDVEGNKVTSFTNDNEWAEKNHVNLTQPFINSDISVITKSVKPVIHSIAVIPEWYVGTKVAKIYPDAQIQEYKTLEECFNAVLAGVADATYVNSVVADYYFTIGRYSILHEEICEDIKQDISFGVTYDSDPMLNKVLSKALLMIKTEEYSTIIKENVNAVRYIGVKDLLYTNPQQLMYIIFTMVVLLAVAIIFAVESRKANKKIKEISNRDVVTGIYNRTALEQRLIQQFEKNNKNVSCIYIDANGLHEINNNRGHEAGDNMLQEIADALKEHFEGDDVYRVGGDEFMVLTVKKEECVVREKLDKVFQQLEEEQISISAGLKFEKSIADSNEMQKLIKTADAIMLNNKQEYYRTHDRRSRR